MERTECIRDLFLNMNPHVRVRLIESCITYQIAVSDCFLAITWKGHMIYLHVYSHVTFTLVLLHQEGFFNGLTITDYLTIQVIRHSIDWPALRNIKVFVCLLFMVCCLKIHSFKMFIWNTATQFSSKKLVRYTTYMRVCVISAVILNTLL